MEKWEAHFLKFLPCPMHKNTFCEYCPTYADCELESYRTKCKDIFEQGYIAGYCDKEALDGHNLGIMMKAIKEVKMGA